MKLTKPYYNCSINHIAQPFGNPQSFGGNHTGVDLSFRYAYGTNLVAPEDVVIKRVIDQKTFDPVKYLENLSKGFGVLMTSLRDPNVDYLYWHLLNPVPVKEGQIIKRGESVGLMGNSGFVFSAGQLVPIEHRSRPDFPGTHLHYEVRVNNSYVNPVPLIDFEIPVPMTKIKWMMQFLNYVGNIFSTKV
jgi:murein DD-endopeptidase MepM/ murein hydrolase activator NlpD